MACQGVRVLFDKDLEVSGRGMKVSRLHGNLAKEKKASLMIRVDFKNLAEKVGRLVKAALFMVLDGQLI